MVVFLHSVFEGGILRSGLALWRLRRRISEIVGRIQESLDGLGRNFLSWQSPLCLPHQRTFGKESAFKLRRIDGDVKF
jgi:hypothetical protein